VFISLFCYCQLKDFMPQFCGNQARNSSLCALRFLGPGPILYNEIPIKKCVRKGIQKWKEWKELTLTNGNCHASHVD